MSGSVSSLLSRVSNGLRLRGLVCQRAPVLAYWWETDETKNVGDMLNPYLIEHICQKAPVRVGGRCFRPHYLCIGSILRKSNTNSIVWGAGILNRNEEFPRPAKIHAVRGPYSKARLDELGYECPEIFGDPALLIPLLYSNNRHESITSDIGLVPHFLDLELVKRKSLDDKIKIISPLSPVESFVRAIRSCRLILSSSLHGIILSHAFGIPAIWVEFSNRVNGDGIKFLDYLASLELEVDKPLDLRGFQTFVELKKNTDYWASRNSCLPPSELVRTRQVELIENCPLPNSHSLFDLLGQSSSNLK